MNVDNVLHNGNMVNGDNILTEYYIFQKPFELVNT